MSKSPPSDTHSEYDVIVVGTGLAESLLAASLSLSGASVLHLDPNSFYGASWSTLSVSQIRDLFSSGETAPSQQQQQLQNDSSSASVQPLPFVSTRDMLFPFGARFLHTTSTEDTVFNPMKVHLDLTPRTIMSASSLIDFLARTNAGHYIDFRPIDQLLQRVSSSSSSSSSLSSSSSSIYKVPASRADVFQSKILTPIEKRLLTRFLHACMDSNPSDNDYDDDNNTQLTFQQFMNDMKLSPKLQSFIHHSIVFSSTRPQQLSFQQGCQNVQRFAQSLIRFSTLTPFLWPNYGTGELSQALCRLCAVRGGTYMLRKRAISLFTSTSKSKLGIITDTNDAILARKKIFIARELLPLSSTAQPNKNLIWRFIGLLNQPVVTSSSSSSSSSSSTSSYRIMLIDDKIYIRQLDHSTFTCPSGMYILYAETITENQNENDLLSCVKRLVSLQCERSENGSNSTDEKPTCLWAMTYAREMQPRHRGAECNDDAGDTVDVLNPLEVEHDVDSVIAEAKRGFRSVFPDGTFFPDLTKELERLTNDLDFDDKEEQKGKEEMNSASDTMEENETTKS